MKKALLDLLICPACLPDEIQLKETIKEVSGCDIIKGELACPQCRRAYPIENGIANLDSNASFGRTSHENKYETAQVVSAYLWSHYADILNDENASDAYRRWADLMQSHGGVAIDAGAAAGRFTFEMGQKSDLAIGLDNSHAFIRAARELMNRREIRITLKQEGRITTDVAFSLPPEWDSEKVEFIVADALALPFRADSTASLSSLNLIDKVH
ncbi:MAG: Trm112 family protein, partial [Desulfobacterales bacterium]|nr:Trm112 family protein [Desulfobacterales bacterium]